MITPGNVDNTFVADLLAAAVAMFAVRSNAREGYFNTFLAHFLPILTELLSRFLKKSLKLSASIVLSLLIIDFFLLHNERWPTSNLFSLPGFFIQCYLSNKVFCAKILFLTNAVAIGLKFLKVLLLHK